MKRIFGLMVLGMLVCTVAEAEDAKYTVENRTDGKIFVSYGLGAVTQDQVFGTGSFSRVKSQGWYSLEKGESKELTFPRRYLVYIFAENSDRKWEGKKKDQTAENFCVYDGKFEYKESENRNEEECKSQLGTEEGKNLRWERFLKVKPGTIPVEE